jgi:uncharacterized protein YlxW (UPF0749 family)
MDHYSLRPSFLPSLAGLHMRIFQFSSLLKQHNFQLFQHLTELGVEPAYLSQWFLSCFAVTCPLPMLFRIYDVIFAEGANETVMRVALALMRRHEERMLACHEFEEIMQLLLGREIWDCYGGDADVLVDDFTSLGEIVTFARLAELERDFETKSPGAVGTSAGFLPDVQAAASRFLGRLWAPGAPSTASKTNATSIKSANNPLSPQSAEKETRPTGLFGRQSSFLRRTPSKQSMSAGTEVSPSDDSASSSGGRSMSTAPTEADGSYIDANGILRESSMADNMSLKSKPESVMPSTPGHHTREEQELHGQIEDLLTALSEMQREHAQLAAMLQREREDRNEDHTIMRQVVTKLRKDSFGGNGRDASQDDRRRTLPPPARGMHLQIDTQQAKMRPLSVGGQPASDSAIKLVDRGLTPQEEEPNAQDEDETATLVEALSTRLTTRLRFSSNLETKAQLRSTLARTREQLASAEMQSRDLAARLQSTEAALDAFHADSEDLRSEVKELRTRVNDDFRARQRLEHQLGEAKALARQRERRGVAGESLLLSSSAGSADPSCFSPPRLRRMETSPDGNWSSARNGSVASLPAVSIVSPTGATSNHGGLRELKLVRRGSASMIPAAKPPSRSNTASLLSNILSPLTTAVNGEDSNKSSPVTSPSAHSLPPLPTISTTSPITPTSGTQPQPFSFNQSASPLVPSPRPHATPAGFSRRTSSLAARDLLAVTTGPQGTPLAPPPAEEDASLLLELVNAKTSEAQARQEVDELKRALAVGRRKQEEELRALRAEIEMLNRSAATVTKGRSGEGVIVRTASLASNSADGLGEDGTATSSSSTAVGGEDGATTGTPPAAAPTTGGWFWNRRTPSTTTAAVAK